MVAVAGLIFLAWRGTGLAPEVTKQDVLRLLQSQASEESVLAYIRQNRPVQVLSAQDVTDLIGAGASDAVVQELLTGPVSRPGSATVLENPPYYPYYYNYYDHYYPQFYTYPGFSHYFYEPSFYRSRPRSALAAPPYRVRPFPYYSHPDWRQHPAYPYHPFEGQGVHPWRDGRSGAHGFGPRPGGPGPGGPRGGGVGGTRGGRGHH